MVAQTACASHGPQTARAALPARLPRLPVAGHFCRFNILSCQTTLGSQAHTRGIINNPRRCGLNNCAGTRGCARTRRSSKEKAGAWKRGRSMGATGDASHRDGAPALARHAGCPVHSRVHHHPSIHCVWARAQPRGGTWRARPLASTRGQAREATRAARASGASKDQRGAGARKHSHRGIARARLATHAAYSISEK